MASSDPTSPLRQRLRRLSQHRHRRGDQTPTSPGPGLSSGSSKQSSEGNQSNPSFGSSSAPNPELTPRVPKLFHDVSACFKSEKPVTLRVTVLQVSGAGGAPHCGSCSLCIRHGCVIHQLDIPPDSNPQQLTTFAFLVERGSTLSFMVTSIGALRSAPLGVGLLVVDDALLADLRARPVGTTVQLADGPSLTGQVHVDLRLEDPHRAPAASLDDFQEVSSPGAASTLRYVEPFLRHLTVKLHSATVPRWVRDPYLVVRCGLFEDKTEVKFGEALPVWDETFHIGVPHATVGCPDLPKTLTWDFVEVALYDWQVTGDILASRVRLKFCDLLGFHGEPVDAMNPPLRDYDLRKDGVLREGILKSISTGDIPSSGQLLPSSAGSGQVRAAVYFDSAYDRVTAPGLGKLVVRFDRLRSGMMPLRPPLQLLLRCGRHWAAFDAPLQREAAEVALGRAFEIAVDDPQMLVTVALVVPAEGQYCKKIKPRAKTLGVCYLRCSSIKPGVWCPAEFPLLTRGSKRCTQWATLCCSVRWHSVTFPSLARAYLRPPLPDRYYDEPWTDRHWARYHRLRRDVVTAFFEKQSPPVHPRLVADLLATEVPKFEVAVVLAQFQRCKAAVLEARALLEALDDIAMWRRPIQSVFANLLFALFAVHPVAAVTCLAASGVLYAARCVFWRSSHPQLPVMDASLFGGVGPEDEDPDEEARRLAANPVGALHKKVGDFESAGEYVQQFLSWVAGIVEGFNSLLRCEDPTITILTSGLVCGVVLLLWLLPASLLVSLLCMYMFRHPSLRDPLPPPPLNLLSRLPDKADRVVYVKSR